MSDVLSVEIVPTGKALGAEIKWRRPEEAPGRRVRPDRAGLCRPSRRADPRTESQRPRPHRLRQTLRRARAAGHEHHRQALSRGLSRRAGDLEPQTEEGTPLGNLGDGEAIWHTDMSYRDTPVSAAILHAWEVPPSGGDTSFANQYLAYETLPRDLRDKIEGRIMVHDETYNSAGQLRKGFKEVTDPREAPGARHPIVRTHPVTGRKCLYLGRRRNGCILGLDLDGQRGNPRPPVGACNTAVLRLDASVAEGRRADLGQPLRSASPRQLRSHEPPHDAPRPGRGRTPG